jgi:hypothetical protein
MNPQKKDDLAECIQYWQSWIKDKIALSDERECQDRRLALIEAHVVQSCINSVKLAICEHEWHVVKFLPGRFEDVCVKCGKRRDVNLPNHQRQRPSPVWRLNTNQKRPRVRVRWTHC